jgi:hypothetical protein
VTKRKHPPPTADTDNYGFDVAGKGFRVTPRELLLLLDLDTLACAMYMRCLKPFADRRSGAVRFASYYRFAKILTPAQSPRGGPRLPEPSRDQLRRCVDRLAEVELIETHTGDNLRNGFLKIWVKKPVSSSLRW